MSFIMKKLLIVIFGSNISNLIVNVHSTLIVATMSLL